MSVFQYTWVEDMTFSDRVKFDCGHCGNGKLIQLKCEPARKRYNHAIMCGGCKRVLWMA